MTEELYNVVFKGELVRSFELATVKNNISQLFKMTGPKLEALFSGKTIILKRNLNFESATKYRVAIKKAGARVDLVSVANTASASAPTQSAPESAKGKAVFGEVASAAPVAPSPSTPVPAEVAEGGGAEQAAPLASGDVFSLAPVGADVLSDAEREHLPVPEIDTSGLSVKEGVGELLEANEKVQVQAPRLDLSGIDMAPQEGNLLKDSERPSVEVVSVDVSGLSMGEPGERLEAPKPPPPPAPDVSNIHLKDE